MDDARYKVRYSDGVASEKADEEEALSMGGSPTQRNMATAEVDTGLFMEMRVFGNGSRCSCDVECS